jgi:hypothetical protein
MNIPITVYNLSDLTEKNYIKKYYKEPKFVKLSPVRTRQFSGNRPDYRFFYAWLSFIPLVKYYIIGEPEPKHF